MVSFVLHVARKAQACPGGLFSRKDPRDAGPLLDIERVLNKVIFNLPPVLKSVTHGIIDSLKKSPSGELYALQIFIS